MRVASSVKSWGRRLCMAVSLTAITVATASAQKSPPASFGGDFWTRPKLTGDWGGIRDQWALKGFIVDLNTVYTLQGVPSGGIPDVSNNLGNTVSDDIVLGLDTTKAGWWPGGIFKLRFENRAGVSALGKAGTVSPVNVDALFPDSLGNLDKSVLGITELTFAQFFSRQVAAFGGLINTLDADDNVIAGDVRGNSTFLNLAFLMSPVEFTGAPNVALGAGVVYVATPNITGTLTVMGSQETATRNPFDNWNGTTIATEWHLKHRIGDLPGGQVVGFLDSINKTRTDIFQDPRVFVGNVSRDGDCWGVGYHHIDISDSGFLTAANLSAENGGEIYCNMAIIPALHATLDSQWVSSARPRQETAGVLGARFNLEF
jgi:porin